jgi:hypothetical protein
MFVSITRLRLRSWRYMPAFAVQALHSALQAKAAQGNLGVAVLAEAHRAFWTQTIWIDESAMRAFMRAGAHRRAMGKLAAWCDEAAVAHWTQQASDTLSWDAVWQRMRSEGRPSTVKYPTAAHTNFRIAAPKVGRFNGLRLK